MTSPNLPADLQKAAEFHGHICPGLLIGYRAALAAKEALGLTPSKDEELVAVVENNSCSVDALQVLLSTTFGKGNLIWADHGKQVFTITDRKQDRAVRVSFMGEHLRKRQPDGSVDRPAFMEALLSQPTSELFKVEEVKAQPPAMAKIEPSIMCSVCGEPTQASRTKKVGDRVMCMACAAKENS
jgi:formylmethanofuran dehydrogenase subunit E